jgi:hypothetical protein
MQYICKVYILEIELDVEARSWAEAIRRAQKDPVVAWLCHEDMIVVAEPAEQEDEAVVHAIA